MQKNIQKYRRRKIYTKILAPGKNLADAKNLAPGKNSADGKNLADAKNLADGKNLADAETRRLGKCWRSWKCWRLRKSRRPAKVLPYCLGSAESATADFSLVPLMSLFSSLLMMTTYM